MESKRDGEINHQAISDAAAAYCIAMGYTRGPTRKVAYRAFVEGMTRAAQGGK